MEREEFPRLLTAALVKRGIGGEEAALRTEEMEKYLRTLPDTEAAELLAGITDADILAAGVCIAAVNTAAGGETDAAQVFGAAASVCAAGGTASTDAASADAASADNAGAAGTDIMAEGDDEPTRPVNITEKPVIHEIEEKKRTSPAVVYLLVLPAVILLWIISAAVFSVFFAAEAALVALLVALLAVFAGGGVALSLTGIIYGITRIIGTPPSLPIGLYEIGLGVFLGGAALFLCVLLYNAAVRLMPFVFRFTGKLLRTLCTRIYLIFIGAKEARRSK